jgi:hypothetical protein
MPGGNSNPQGITPIEVYRRPHVRPPHVIPASRVQRHDHSRARLGQEPVGSRLITDMSVPCQLLIRTILASDGTPAEFTKKSM